MKQIKYTFYCLGLTLLMWSCYAENEEDLFAIPANNSTVKNDTNSTAVSFSMTIAPLISNNCATTGCHKNNAQSPNLVSYQDISSQAARIKARAVDENPSIMPPTSSGRPGLTAQQKSDLSSWISNGAPNN